MPQSYCGQNCEKCPVYNLKYIDKPKTSGLLAKNWSATFKTKLARKEFYCDGCKSQNRFAFCRNCEIELCCIDKNVENCACCAQQKDCPTHISFWEWFNNNKQNLMWDKVQKPF